MQLSTQNANQVQINTYPDRCPVCLHAIQPLDTNQGFLGPHGLENIARCPRQQCGHFFIVKFEGQRQGNGTVLYVLKELVPLTIEVSAQSEVIKGISPNFATIFAEAEKAEKLNLKLICGPGYRKAIEFLIKDYVIQSHPEKGEEIKNLNLAKCIADYVQDGRVKQVAARAVWLGNDETHYLRKWEDKDLTDLKRLIQLTLHWIEMDDLTKKTLEDMPEGK
jgi:hypothetical protein